MYITVCDISEKGPFWSDVHTVRTVDIFFYLKRDILRMVTQRWADKWNDNHLRGSTWEFQKSILRMKYIGFWFRYSVF